MKQQSQREIRQSRHDTPQQININVKKMINYNGKNFINLTGDQFDLIRQISSKTIKKDLFHMTEENELNMKSERLRKKLSISPVMMKNEEYK